MKFVLFVEGHTERRAIPQFLKRWLDPRLSAPVGIKTVRFEGWADYASEIGKKVHLNLSGHDAPEIVGAIGLLDLCGPQFYPAGVNEAPQRRAWAKQWFEQTVQHPHFRQHFAVHEIEAWLLSDPSILPADVAASLPKRVVNPEGVNFHEQPSDLLDRFYRQKVHRGYRKIIDGSDLFRRLDPDAAYGTCPSLRALLDEMLAMAR